nr:MAG TPA: hypothetical protein [Caudoviricetes sp.]
MRLTHMCVTHILDPSAGRWQPYGTEWRVL